MQEILFFYGLDTLELGKPWGLAIATYLFLGGLAGGMYLIGYLMTFLKEKSDFARAVERFGILSSGIVLLLGLLSLILDHPNVIMSVINPFLFSNLNSWLSRGSWIILFFLIIWFILFIENFGVVKIPESLKMVILSVNAFLAFMVILYTALLLRGATFVPLWMSNAIPPLFVVSGVSTGLALCLIYGVLKVRESERLVVKLDIALIAIEIVLVLYLISDLQSIATNALYNFIREGARASLEYMLSGDLSFMFLIGFIGVGLILPLIFYAISFIRKTHTAEILSGISVLAGGYVFRVVIISAAFKALILP